MSTFESGPTVEALADLLQPSPYPADDGERIGKDPREVPAAILSRWHREANPLKALRARCLDCCCGSAPEVRKCTAVACPSWPFRMGSNPFREKRVLSPEQKLEMVERLARAREGASEQTMIPGMVFFSGTGPTGKTCRGCIHWQCTAPPNDPPWNRTIHYCLKHAALMGGRRGPQVKGAEAACKYFEEASI